MFKKKTTLGSIVALTYLSTDVQAAKAKFRPLPGTAPWYKMASHSTWEKPDWDVNYFVPDFGKDTDIQFTQDHLAEAESSLKHKMQASFKKPELGYPVDYFVPNFGPDHDIKLTQDNTSESEQELAHKWVPTKAADPPPRNYFVPNFGKDRDMTDNMEDLDVAEKALSHKWKYDPNAKKAAAPPRNYFVPNFGMDDDIKTTQ